MWDVEINGYIGWEGPKFVYANQVSGFTEEKLRGILAQVVACETIDGFGCGISDADLFAAMKYSQLYKIGSEILCTTYLKTNLIYDLQTNTKGISNFTDIHFHDLRAEPDTDYDDLFQRYFIFQQITSNSYPGDSVEPVMVDIMFQIVAINEGEILNLRKKRFFKYNQVNLAGEFMDIVLALTLEWYDWRLEWDEYEWGETVIKTLQVDSSDIWTPNIDLANRNHDFSLTNERHLETTIRFDGKISLNNYDTK